MASIHIPKVFSTVAILQPGQTATIFRKGECVGVVGKLHPEIGRRIGIDKSVFLFELDADKSFAACVPVAKTVSRYPIIRRDIAIVVKDEVTASDLVVAAESAAPELVQSVRIFDVYRGPGIEAGLKSIALGLILQETSRTLTDVDADAAMTAAVRKLEEKFAAELRD